MPVHACPNGKYRIGTGPCVYDTKAKAERAYAGYMASKRMTKGGEERKTLIGTKIDAKI
uniref:Uncharacterized protein n=1 Tax=viral metagenome TaxID=1070528 RepID=A0A6M3L2Q6_9ZZZZ